MLQMISPDDIPLVTGGEKKVESESPAYEGPPPTKDKILWCLVSSQFGYRLRLC